MKQQQKLTQKQSIQNIDIGNIKSAKLALHTLKNNTSKPFIIDYKKALKFTGLSTVDEFNYIKKSSISSYTSIISHLKQDVNGYKELKEEAKELFSKDFDLDISIIADEIKEFTNIDLANLKTMYENASAYFHKANRGLPTLMQNFAGYFDETGPKYLLREYYNELAEMHGQEFKRLYRGKSADWESYIQNSQDIVNSKTIDFYKQVEAMTEAEAKKALDKLYEDFDASLVDDTARAYVLDMIKENQGIKGIQQYDNVHSFRAWIQMRHDILYELLFEDETKFGSNAPRSISASESDELIAEMRELGDVENFDWSDYQ